MGIVKIIKKILLGVLVFMLISMGIIFTLVSLNKDEIIDYFVNQANKQISTPIEVGKIDISLFNHFPNISIDLQDVTIKESYKGNKGVLGKAENISFAFSLFDLINKNYEINGLHITEANVDLKINNTGLPNYLIFKKDSTSKGSMFSINNITASDLTVNYIDVKSDVDLNFIIKKAKSNVVQELHKMLVVVDGELIADEIRVGNRKFLNNKAVEIDAEIDIDLDKKIYQFTSCNLNIDRGEFEVKGNVNATENSLSLDFKGIKTSFRTINSLLSSDLSKYLQEYNSKGEVYFTGSVSGLYGSNNRPHFELNFGAKNASFFHPKYKKQIEQVYLTGLFTTGQKNLSSTYQLELKDFSCVMDNKLLEGQLVVHDFNSYKIDLFLNGEADVNSLVLLFPRDRIKTAFGSIKMNVHLNGDIQNPKLSKNFNADGDVVLKNLSFVLKGEKLPFNRINGALSLRKNDLAISNLSGFVGQSDFSINGFFKDFSRLLIQKNSPIKVQADLKSKHIDFDELLKSNFASRDTMANQTQSRYAFSISPRISIDFNCAVDHLKFRKFRGSNIVGQVDINNQIAILKNVSFSSMGGRINISGSVNNKSANLVETISEANLYDISIDSVFYVFNNFNQNWLIDRNLKGQLDADVNLYMNFDQNLVLNSNTLVADIQTSIINGELNDFEPMMKLSKFVEEESLAQMRFSRMTNNIRIENEIIYLPEMEIRSNVSNILVKGQHSFDKSIDYRLQVPLKNFIRLTRRKDFEQSARQGMNLMLKITGTTSDYAVSYDGEALKESIKNDILDEGQEWKNLKNKNQSEEAPEFEDEYFDFEEDLSDTTNQSTF
jgi:hypothetical protein